MSFDTMLAARWAAAPILSQAAAVGACALGAVALRAALVPALRARAGQDPAKNWPLGVVAFAILLGIVFSLLDLRDMQREIVRVCALMAAAGAAIALTMRAVGPTALGVALSLLAAAIAGLEAFHLFQPLATALDAQAIEVS
ncbi:MAG: hypothetical protein R3C25_08685, partial [Hyphomonadaceae bacterium]